MANRGIVSADLLDAIDKKLVVYYEAIKITTVQDSSTVVYRVTNAPQNITVDSETYIAFGQYLSTGPIEEDATLDIPQLTVSISGIAPFEADAPVTGESFMQTMVKDTTIYIDQPIERYRVYFDLNWVDKGSVLLFRGRLSNASIKYDIEGVSNVTLEASSHWVDFTRKSGRFTNNNSQQSISDFSADVGFEYAKDVMKDIIWQEPPE